MASSNTANWSVYSRNGEANVEGLLSWFEGPKYLPFALSATRIHLTPTSYQQTRQLFISHKLAHQSQIRELPAGRPQSKGWERKGGLWLTAMPFARSASPILSSSVPSGESFTSKTTQHTESKRRIGEWSNIKLLLPALVRGSDMACFKIQWSSGI